jgi:hypothetical protein
MDENWLALLWADRSTAELELDELLPPPLPPMLKMPRLMPPPPDALAL